MFRLIMFLCVVGGYLETDRGQSKCMVSKARNNILCLKLNIDILFFHGYLMYDE